MKKKTNKPWLLRRRRGDAKVLGLLHGEVHCACARNDVMAVFKMCPYPFNQGEVHCADKPSVEFDGETDCAEFNG